MKNIKNKMYTLPIEMLNQISGGVFSASNSTSEFGFKPKINANENGAGGTISLNIPITANIGVSASTAFATDYDKFIFPNNAIGVYIAHPLK